MVTVLTPQDVKDIDTACVNEAGIAVQVLMENAARSAVDIILTLFTERRKVLVLCGNGNNGGDGYAIARLLADHHDVMVAANPMPDRMSEATQINFRRVKELIPIMTFDRARSMLHEAEVIIDAVFGVGFKGSLRDTAVNWFSEIQDSFKISIDVPSGLDALTGHADEFAFCADLTITMEGLKLGMLCNRGIDISGDVRVATIGAPKEIIKSYTSALAVEEEDIRVLLPVRNRKSSKFDYGRVLVIAGSTSMPGAASLTSHAALRSGAGLVELATTKVHPLTPREVISFVLPSTKEGTISNASLEIIHERLKRATVVAVGPGIGNSSETLDLLASILESVDESVPIIIDADGLRIVNRIPGVLSHSILTPHHGEFAHVVGQEDVLENTTCLDRIECCKQLAREKHCVVHLKSYPSITTDGETVYLTRGGNPGMATAGSGDVLTGIIAGLCAQHVPMLEAASLGSFIHCRAADSAVEFMAPESMIASDIIDAIGMVIPRV